MERPDISNALGTKVVALQAADGGKIYVHKALLNCGVVGVGGCKWSCFTNTIVKSFVEYLYQGDYTLPLAPKYSSWNISTDEWGSLYSDYKDVFLTHAQLFILSRHRKVPSLASLCLKRLEEAMVEAQAQDTAEESLFMRNMRALIKYSYYPCPHDCDDDGMWEELQKTVCGFLVSQKGLLLEAPGSSLISEEKQLTEDLLTKFINLSIDTDKLLMEAGREREALKTELAQIKSAKKKKRQALTIQVSVKKYEEANAYHIVLSSD